ncbi:adhesion G-protein coupled receptor G2-like [Physella acuta]|uniref:adhesion G-protein coupled receptor G2-like n=1 Tax=Physella acuta TaxID=109671 RepID=UPI0027DBAFC3|nr:adhesion G-protein coupled receptor G2-like [Physella acuta]
MFNLSLALLMAWIVFLAGINQTSSHAGCIVVAVLLHYLILASFMWMLMEGILQYLLFVKVMNIYFHRYLLKTALPAWGLPVVPVIIILIIDKELYKGGNEYCWMSLPALYYGFAIPIGIIILTNIVFFIMVTVSLCRRRDMSKHSTSKRNQTVVNVRASFICFCVLGLSWIFGFLAIADARVAFQYLFCIFNTLQGFIMFIMMTARDSNVRKYWLSKFYKHRKKEKERKTGKSNSENTNFYPKAAATNNTVSSNSNSKSTTTTIFDGIDKH